MYKRAYLSVIGCIIIFIIGIIVFLVLKAFGSSYSQNVPSSRISDQSIEIKEKKRLRKITVTDEETGECLEITNDGVVRRYETCDGQLQDATRLFDPKRIIQLFEYASRIDPNKFRNKPQGAYIRLIIETDAGSDVVYVPVTDEPESISEVIDLIKGDLPQPTPTLYIPTTIPTPTLPGTTIIPTITPTPTLLPGITPTPEPSLTEQQFTCGFTDDPSEIRPFNVSNYICSTEPSPAP